MRNIGRRTTLTIVGGALIAVGVVLMPVPLLPGIPVVVAGVALVRKARSKPGPQLPPEEIVSDTVSA